MEVPYHIPVLLQASVEGLTLASGGRYVDATFGGGGHTRHILSQLEGGQVISFDKDPDARANLPEDGRLVFVAQDFKFLETALQQRELLPVNGILADLGISSHQIDTPERGFSFRYEAPLDMRMDPEQELHAGLILNEYDQDELADIFYQFGEIHTARKVARILVEYRSRALLRTTRDLETALRPCMPPKRQAKFLAQVYQALRIVVNGELEALAHLLNSSLRVLAPGGRLAIISYHSLEDRMVKRFLRSGNFEGKEEKDFYGNSLSPWKLITRKAIMPTEEEIASNPRARSARLRVAEKK